ncbi:hypothetical protein [Streptomyces sp. NPDC003832]
MHREIRGHLRLNRPATSGCRVLLGTRPWWDTLPALRRHLAGRPSSVLDLDPKDDETRHALAADLDNYLRRLLRPRELEARERLRDVAHRLAEYTDHGAFLVAAVYAEHLRATPSAEAAPPPCTVTEVFALHTETLAASDPWIRPVLDVLGRARGHGMPLELVHTVALAHRPPDAGEPTPQLADTRRALTKAAFHLRTTPDSDQRLLYRYFHQALADHTVPRTDPTVFHQVLLSTVPASPDNATDWPLAHPYLRRHTADHAADVGGEAVAELLLSPGYLEVADLERLLPLADRLSGAERIDESREIVRQVVGRTPRGFGQGAQGSLLGLAALHLGLDHDRAAFDGAATRGVRGVWATAAVRRLRSLPVQPDAVVSIDAASVPGPAGTTLDLIATGCADGCVRVWDASSMKQISEFDLAPARPVGVRLASGAQDHQLVVMDDGFGIWSGDFSRGSSLYHQAQVFQEPQRPGRTWMVRAPDGKAPDLLHIVWGRAEGDEYETRFADLHLGTSNHRARCGVLRGSPILHGNSELGAWPYGGGVLHLPTGDTDSESTPSGTAAAVVAVANSLLDELCLYDLDELNYVARVLMGSHRAVTKCRTVLIGRMDDVPVAVTGDYQGQIQIRGEEPDEDQFTFAAQPATVFAAHFRAVKDVALATFEGRQILLSSGEDGAVHLWAPGEHAASGRAGHFTGTVTSLATAELPQDQGGTRTVILAGDTAGNAAATRADRGSTLYTLPSRDDGEVTGVATAVLPVAGIPRLLGATCSTDEAIRLFDLETGEAVGRPFSGVGEYMQTSCRWSAITAGPLAGRDVVVGAAAGHYRRHSYNSLYIWVAQDWSDTASRDCLVEPLFGPVSGHRGPIPCVTLGAVEGQDVIVTGCMDGHVRVWDGTTFEQLAPPLSTGSSAVYDVWLGELDGREVILAVCGDGSLHRWDTRTFTSLGEPITAHTRQARGLGVTTGTGHPVVVTTGLDATVRTWDPATWRAYGPTHPLLYPGTALTCTGSTAIVASGSTLVRFDVNPDLRQST